MVVKSGLILVGSDRVLAKLNKEVRGIKNRTVKGMRTAVLLVKGDSVKGTPIRFGHLRGSAYTEVNIEFTSITGVIGYTASYAPFVHEIKKKYNRGSWKYLEKALKKNRKAILKILRNEAAIK